VRTARPTDQTLTNRLLERAKLSVLGTLHRFDLELSRGAFANRLVRTLKAHGIDTVLDIGANVGQYGLNARRAGFTGRIISVEPLTGAYGELAKRAARDSAWLTLNAAAGRESGEVEINVSANSFSSSVLPMSEAHLTSAPRSVYIAKETVRVVTVADLVQTNSVDPARTLLKIDTQGYEAEVIAGADKLITEFAALQLELSLIELYNGQQLAEEIVDQLRRWGYRLQTLEPGLSAADGRLLQADILVVRDPPRC
jgi:FkbM family methyltransferase